MAEIYDIGDEVQLQAGFTDPVSGVAVDPDTVTCSVKPPGAAPVDAPVDKLATGSYRALFSPAVDGRYYYRFSATGGYKGAEEGSFQVRASAVT